MKLSIHIQFAARLCFPYSRLLPLFGLCPLNAILAFGGDGQYGDASIIMEGQN